MTRKSHAILDIEVEDRGDAGMREARQDERLAAEALAGVASPSAPRRST